MDNYNLEISELKKIIVDEEFRRFPYIKYFSKNPYTFLKSRYYIFFSIYLVYALLRTNITANMVSMVYIMCGFIGAVFLAIPSQMCVLIGIFIFFNKGILDWSDGHLARIKFKPSLTGHILDEYGARTNSLGLNVGLGFFVFNQSEYNFIIYLIVLLPVFYSEKFTSFASGVILQKLINGLEKHETYDNLDTISVKSKNSSKSIAFLGVPKFLLKLRSLFDDNARNTDLVLLIIFIDVIYEQTFSVIIFLVIFLRNLFTFVLNLFYGVRSKWAENLYKEAFREK